MAKFKLIKPKKPRRIYEDGTRKADSVYLKQLISWDMRLNKWEKAKADHLKAEKTKPKNKTKEAIDKILKKRR